MDGRKEPKREGIQGALEWPESCQREGGDLRRPLPWVGILAVMW